MLDPFAQLLQHCWGHAPSLRMDYKDLWVVFFQGCTAGPKLVGSCCTRLHTTANTHATTSNIDGAIASYEIEVTGGNHRRQALSEILKEGTREALES